MRKTAVVIMAAGLGTRMKSETVKVLHSVAGRPMIYYPIRSALELGAERIVVVLGHQRDRVDEYISAAFPEASIETVLQAEQLGTAHAVLCARNALADFEGDVFILSGDVPTLPTAFIRKLSEVTGSDGVGVVGMRLDEPRAYGRFVRNSDGSLCRIVEARDCTPEQLCIQEVNAGIYRVDARFLFQTLAGLGTDNAQGEYYLTDLVQAASDQGRGVAALVLEGADAEEAGGVNDRLDLAAAEGRMQRRLRRSLMLDGVTLVDPDRVTLHDGVTVGPDTVIEPDVSLLGQTHVGANGYIAQGVRLMNTTIGDRAHIKGWCHFEQTVIGHDAELGPFARLRPGTQLGNTVRIGNFVETKKAHLGDGVKASHLSYIGDATVGAGVNIGAGTITCNYDGKVKSRTEIGPGAFIGSDTQLVAPVTVGEGAYVGAGTTVTKDVPPNALALSRTPQRNIEGWADRKRARDAARGKD